MNNVQLDWKYVSCFSADTINYKFETRSLYRNLLTLNESAVKVKCSAVRTFYIMNLKLLIETTYLLYEV